MRKLLRSIPFRVVGRSTPQVYDQQANDQKSKNWTNRLGQLASSAQSKIYLSQLGALLNYYNRLTIDITKEILWNDWRTRITTPGLVDRLKQSYQALERQNYRLEALFDEVFNRDSKAIDQINSEMAFHIATWLDCYIMYVHFLNELKQVSNPKDYNPVEWNDMHPGLQPRVDELVETHCYFAGSKDDVNLWAYMGKQFAWGKKIITFYRHPADDFKDGKGTKNSMGR